MDYTACTLNADNYTIQYQPSTLNAKPPTTRSYGRPHDTEAGASVLSLEPLMDLANHAPFLAVNPKP